MMTTWLRYAGRAAAIAAMVLLPATVGAQESPGPSATPTPRWTVNGAPSAQARAMLALLRDARARGLDPLDYDADALTTMAASLETRTDSVEARRFDAMLTRSAAAFLRHVHEGRVPPQRVGFHLPDVHRDLDASALALAASTSADPAALVQSIEPPYRGYAALERALARYRALAADSTLHAPRAMRTPVRRGDSLPDAASLTRLLVALGDMPAPSDSVDSGAPGRLTTSLSAGIAAYQRRHGMPVSGSIDAATLRALRVPLADRVRQIELSLERLRWLPDAAPPRYAVVNIPAFRLYLFEDDPTGAHPLLRMNVIVGRASRARTTPIFTGTMREVVFNPYWDVPPSIARNEVLPAIRRRPKYYYDEGMEIVRGGDEGAVIYEPTSENLWRVSSGSLRIRQRPGPINALGEIKFVFPNSHNVYLHGTPARQLFAESRRDFSHGCIRVEDPRALAELVLRGQPGWDRSAIDSAVDAGRTRHLPIARPITVFVLYQTAAASENDVVHFYDDLYGHDAALSRTLRERRSAERVARASAAGAPATD